MERQKIKCWYCGRKTNDRGGNLFCRKCEKIKIKETVRPPCENAQSKEFGRGTIGLGV